MEIILINIVLCIKKFTMDGFLSGIYLDFSLMYLVELQQLSNVTEERLKVGFCECQRMALDQMSVGCPQSPVGQ